MLVAVTRLRLRSARFFLPFLWHAIRSQAQARRAQGHRASITRKAGGAYWTLTLWQDKAAMRQFMLSGAHRNAMPHLQHWCDEAAVAQWEQDLAVLPPWPEAERRLTVDGRVSTLHHPSPAHRAGAALGSHAAAQ